MLTAIMQTLNLNLSQTCSPREGLGAANIHGDLENSMASNRLNDEDSATESETESDREAFREIVRKQEARKHQVARS
jgi:hypothetical protein